MDQQVCKDILFIDIETVSCVRSYQELTEPLKLLWNRKASTIQKDKPIDFENLFFEKAAIYAEFGKIIAIGVGFITYTSEGIPKLRVKGISSYDEKELLQLFKIMVEERFPQSTLRLCAHNGKEFDFPYLCRRMIVHDISLPAILTLSNKKPWEVVHLDTMEMWKFGDRKNFTSLHLLATLFNITSSKEIMNGSEVNTYYYHKQNLDAITHYCIQDVIILVQIFLKMNCIPPILPEHIMLI